MHNLIKRLAVASLAVATVVKTFGVLFSNDTSSRIYGGFSPTDANQATNTFNDDRPKKSQSPDTDSGATKANATVDLRSHLLRHDDDVNPMCAIKIEVVSTVNE